MVIIHADPPERRRLFSELYIQHESAVREAEVKNASGVAALLEYFPDYTFVSEL